MKQLKHPVPSSSGTTAWMLKVGQRMEQLPRGLGMELSSYFMHVTKQEKRYRLA
jgi:hypothetical protein